MYKGLNIGAVVVAAGKGKRMGSQLNKQYLSIEDKPVLAHTLLVLSSVEFIDRIVVVVGEDEIDYCKDNIINRYNIRNASDIIAGGAERQNSMINGLNALKDLCDIVITHDGARPLITTDIIEKSVTEAILYGAAACAVPVKDTIKVSDNENYIIDTPERRRLYAVQTPQTFKYELICKAHDAALKESFIGTDDTVLVERIGTRVKLFEGSYENIKITTPEDVFIAEAIIEYRKLNKQVW